jgi:myosin-5
MVHRAGVFDWIVAHCNARLDMGKKSSGNFIAILDIYGFEKFEVNRWGQHD